MARSITLTTGFIALATSLATSLACATPAFAQQGVIGPLVEPPSAAVREQTAFDGDFISVGAGAVLSPSYTGSDDYVISPIPVVTGSFGGVQFTPRGAGLSIDFVPYPVDGVGLVLGVAGRLRSDRAVQIEDEVVESLGELDRAVELGPVVGFRLPGVTNPYDSLTVSLSAGWDVAGAHGGMVLEPSVSFATPLSRALFASLSVSSQFGDGEFQDYYFRVTPEQSAATGGELPVFEPKQGGFTRAGANFLLGYDLNGNLADGGLGLIGILGYSRVLGDAKRSPFTSVRGSADQFIVGGGIGYTF